MVFQVRQMLEEHKAKLEGSEEKDITAACDEVDKLVKEKAPKDQVEAARKRLETVAQGFGKRVYDAASAASQAGPAPEGGAGCGPDCGPGGCGPQAGPGPKKGGDDVKDADFTVVKDK
jgi:hypothetical protein